MLKGNWHFVKTRDKFSQKVTKETIEIVFEHISCVICLITLTDNWLNDEMYPRSI